MNEDFLSDLASEAADVSSVPSEQGTARLRKMADEMVGLEREIEELKNQLRDKNVRLWELKTSEMPALMEELGVDRFGLSSAGVDLVCSPYYKANISADWPEEQREAGFAHLEEVGGGDIITNTVTAVFPRGHFEELQEWVHRVRGLNLDFDPPDLVVSKTVPWNTLTAYVKEQVERGTVLDLEKLGATVGSIVKIQKRKN